MDKFQNKYRIQSHRKPNWDYSSNALYYITLVVQGRECLLGKIVDAEMFLSEFGRIVYEEWHKSFDLRKELFLDEYVIMPNNIHAVIVLEQPYENVNNTECRDTRRKDTRPCVFTTSHDIPKLCEPQSFNPPVRLPQSISSFIGGFKSAVNTEIDDYIDENNLRMTKYNRHNHFFQPNYHDHIIRNAMELENIRNYIINNTANWEKDELS